MLSPRQEETGKKFFDTRRRQASSKLEKINPTGGAAAVNNSSRLSNYNSPTHKPGRKFVRKITTSMKKPDRYATEQSPDKNNKKASRLLSPREALSPLNLYKEEEQDKVRKTARIISPLDQYSPAKKSKNERKLEAMRTIDDESR